MKAKTDFYVACSTCDARHKSIFCNLLASELGSFDLKKQCLLLQKGEVIFRERSHPKGVYCIYSGKVKIGRRGQDGKEQIVRLAKETDLVGYRALLSNQPYYATATALTEVKICFIPAQQFFEVLNKNSAFALQIIQFLSTELGKAEDQITDLAQKPVRERMAEALLLLKETYGMNPQTSTIDVCLSRMDIANLVGTATETAIRLLSELRQQEIVSFDGKMIRIENYAKLVELANIQD